MKTSRILIFFIILGLIIRLMLASIPGFKIDVDTWLAWAIRLNQLGLSQFYSDQVWTNYTPGYLYILAFLGFIKTLFSSSDHLFYVLLKLPAIIAEVGLGIFVYYLISKKNYFWGLISSLAILFTPAFIFNSAIWGQIDGLLSLTIFLSIYYLSQKKLILASIILGLSFLIKPQTISILPLFALYLLKHFSLKNTFNIILPFSLTVLTFSLPFYTSDPTGIFKLFSKMVSDYSFTSLFAYNIWGIVGFWINDQTLWNNFSYYQIGNFIFIFYWLLITYLYLKGKLSLFSAAALATLAFFFLPTRVHERYLYPALVLLFVTAGLLRSRLIFILTSILSFLHFLNIYYVYVYYNEFYSQMPKLLYSPLYDILFVNGKTMSIISTVFFVLISITLIKRVYVSKKD